MTNGWTKKTITTNGQQICVYDSETGSRGVVLLSHSILSAAAMWEAQAALLHQGGYRVLAMDTRGHGASGPTELGFSLDDLGRDCIGVLDALGQSRAHFMGLSLGGMIGIGLGIPASPPATYASGAGHASQLSHFRHNIRKDARMHSQQTKTHAQL